MVILAADGANPAIKLASSAYIKVTNGANLVIKGVKFDGFVNETPTVQYAIRPYDASESTIEIENCEFYGFLKNIITCSEGNRCNSLVINNCYFHNNNGRAAVYFPASNVENQQTVSVVRVTNSTFANNNAANDYVGIIDVRSYGLTATDDIEVLVDHCTFYDNTTKNDDYASVNTREINHSTVSNCIFAHSEAYARRATFMYNGSNAINCIMYNLTVDADKYGHTWMTTRTGCFSDDPLFTDAANGDFSLANNWVSMNISPARGAATDGSDLGDPRWYSDPVLPNVDFATPYVLDGLHAKLSGCIALDGDNFLKQNNNSDPTQHGKATWKIHATKSCYVSVTPDIKGGSGHHYQIAIYDANNTLICDPLEENDSWDDEITPNFGTILIPAAGDYKVVLSNLMNNSSATLRTITFAYVGGDVQAMPGTTDIDDAWFSSNGTRTAGEKIVIPSGHQHEGWVKWNVSFANAANYKAKVNINCDNGHNYTVALYEDEDDLTPITWGEGAQTEDDSPLDLGAKEVPAGNYILKVTNAVQYSHAELVSVQFVNAGGGLVNIPGNITLTEAILSSRAYIDENGEIRFTDDAHAGHVTEESAAWRVNVSKAGYYKFTTSVNSVNGHSYLVSIYNADETVLKGSVVQSGDDIWGAPKTFSTDEIYLEAGEYRVKVQNTTNNSKGRIVSISASYEGGALVNLPNDAIPFADAILSENATRNLESVPQEIHFGSPNATQYAQWNIHAVAGLYTFTFDVVGTNYGTYKLDILEGNDNIFTDTKGKEGSGQVTISNVFIPAEGDYVLQLANTNSGANGYLTSLAATAATDVFVLDENTEDDGSIAAAAATEEQYTFLIKRAFSAGKYYTICLPVSSWDSELKLAFGADYELWKMSSATQTGDEIDLNFEQVNSEGFSAGIPYIIKPSVDVENPILYNKKHIKNYTYNNVQDFTAADFVGTFYKDEIPAGMSNLYLQNNNLYYSESNNTPIKGMRAWIRLKSQSSAPARARIVLGEQVATEINFVNGESINGLVKTIENGQLVIIKNGVKYNVMGIKLQ